MSIAVLLPLVFMLATALAEPETGLKYGASLREIMLPRTWHWENFADVWRTAPFLRYYINSLVVAGFTTFGQVLMSACAAYAFARIEWPGRDKVFFAYLATMMVPNSVTMIPNFISMKFLPDLMQALIPFINWTDYRYLGSFTEENTVGRLVGLDSYFALIVPGVFSAYGTFLLRQFLLGIPKELDEAAKIDGCTHWQIFTRIILPLARPGLVTLTLFTFMGTWSSFFWPLVTTTEDALRTLPLGLQSFQSQYGTEWHLVMAAALLMLIPVVILFLIGQNLLIKGLTVAAMKE